jgi:diguanylate cyclase (GGDEF)-like protein
MLMPEPYQNQHDGHIDNYVKTGQPRAIAMDREVEGLRKNGAKFPMDVALTEVRSEGKRFFIGIIRDITERKAKGIEVEKAREELALANKELEKLVHTDGLTSIANRRYFDEVLKNEFQRALRQKYHISLLMFDVDHFKKYNDHYGHSDGDKCLIKIALATDGQFRRAGELVARYGGEEFVVILPNTDADTAKKDAENLLGKIRSLRINHEASPTSEYVSISIGVSTMIPSRDTTLKHLLLSADEALYKAKENGRDQVYAQMVS